MTTLELKHLRGAIDAVDRHLEGSGLVFTDDLSLAGQGSSRAAPLSFIGPQGFAQWIADGQPGGPRNHVSFSFDAQGDALRLYSTNGTNFILIDSVTFGAQQRGVSQGRLPDGDTGNIVSFTGSSTAWAVAVKPDKIAASAMRGSRANATD